jgi:hypothetical protein
MASEPKVYRGTTALQRGRWSSPGASYFISGNLDRPVHDSALQQFGLDSRQPKAALHRTHDERLRRVRQLCGRSAVRAVAPTAPHTGEKPAWITVREPPLSTLARPRAG